jgi:hypothetical protein
MSHAKPPRYRPDSREVVRRLLKLVHELSERVAALERINLKDKLRMGDEAYCQQRSDALHDRLGEKEG